MNPFPGFNLPTSTDTPNEFFTQVAPRITKMSVMKVVIYTIYRTFGFRKWEDWISLSQYEHGTGHNDDHGCGLSHVGILAGLKLAVEDGYLRCRVLCPHCHSEVKKTDVQVKSWKNRHGKGSAEIPIVPELCPHCAKTLRGQEHSYYRLAFRDELVDEFDRPQDYLNKYHWRETQVENSSFEAEKLEKATSPQVENSSTQVENSSSEPKKLEKATSQSLIRSQSLLQSRSEDDPLLRDLIDLIPDFKDQDRDAFLNLYDVDTLVQWCAYALDPHNQVRNPAGFLVHCCLRQGQRQPNVAYAEHEIRRILAIHRLEARRQEPAKPEQIVFVEPPPRTEQSEPDPEAVAIWGKCLPDLEMAMTRQTFERWIRPVRPLRLEEDRFTIGVDNIYAQEWLATRLRKPIERALFDHVGCHVEAVFHLGDGVQTPEPGLHEQPVLPVEGGEQ